MKQKILRIYMKQSEQAKNLVGFWQKIFNPGLAFHLIKGAKAFGIEQAIVQKVSSGYLKGAALAFDMVEVAPLNLPLCLELIDSEERLRKFLNEHTAELENCRVVMIDSVEILKKENVL